jgi:ribosomal protein S18 acetylase RimI-like enzyme
MPLEIRQITDTDAAAWWALRLRALRESPEAFGSTYDEAVERPLAIAARRALPDPDAPDNFTLGAFAPELVGFVGFEREEGRKNRHKGSIWGMFVAPESRGQGIGRELLAALVARARQQDGLEQIILTVVSENAAARELYRSYGFTTYGVEPRSLRDDGRYYDEDLMVLWLSPAP